MNLDFKKIGKSVLGVGAGAGATVIGYEMTKEVPKVEYIKPSEEDIERAVAKYVKSEPDRGNTISKQEMENYKQASEDSGNGLGAQIADLTDSLTKETAEKDMWKGEAIKNGDERNAALLAKVEVDRENFKLKTENSELQLAYEREASENAELYLQQAKDQVAFEEMEWSRDFWKNQAIKLHKKLKGEGTFEDGKMIHKESNKKFFSWCKADTNNGAKVGSADVGDCIIVFEYKADELGLQGDNPVVLESSVRSDEKMTKVQWINDQHLQTKDIREGKTVIRGYNIKL